MSRIFFLFAVFINFVALSASQECNPKEVEWFPHQYSCQKYVLCFHGNPLERSCAPGLHFSANTLKCMLPADAECRENYVCPPVDDVNNPIILPDTFDCQRYFVCFRGSPIQRICAEGLWFDALNKWCTTADVVTCDDRTVNNPNEPRETTTVAVDPPTLSICGHTSHLFNPVSGAYMKSSCIVRRAINYDESEEICQQNNMNLFAIDSSFVQTAFQTASTNVLKVWYPIGGEVWINGRRETSLEWMTYIPHRQPLYQGIEWLQTENINGSTSGDCLRFSAQHGPYMPMGDPCERRSYAYCEFFSEPVLNTDVCWHRSSIVDDNGNHLKSSCLINTFTTHWLAQETCRQNGMNLFVINNSTVQSEFHKIVTEALIDNQVGHVWINGWQENSEWFVYDPIRSPLYDDIDWFQTETIDGRTAGPCLIYTATLGPYLARGTDCQGSAWFVCEY